ncbi:MAG TPA: argininosuccinate lyase [Arachidicoccus sp.]|nr:argininosuccinate lyase [Arachidicoccus sp.]
MKLWAKNTTSLKEVETFTIGRDREFDILLAPFDALGNMAHAEMLATIGLLTRAEKDALVAELKTIYEQTQIGDFQIQADVEDVHSQIEFLLTQKLGDIGKKIHSARSRNDQVLVDVKLFLRSEIEKIVEDVKSLFELLIAKSNEYKDMLLPGYTHLQIAMPSSFGLWLGAYAESLVDDLTVLQSAYQVVNKNPLGSAAGYGSSFPINRQMTTDLLGFADLNYNVVYAQMGRGKAERITAMGLANIAETLAKLAMDACLYNSQNFSFISFPAELTTGSSIMPHKKNPDVFELIRGYSNRLKALPNEIMMMTTNLPSGYHRELQLLKEHLFPAFGILHSCIEMTGLMISHMEVKKDIVEDPKYKYIFSVEEVNKLVLQGVPFRDAYKQVGLGIEAGKFDYSTSVHHTHEGSLGNLCNDRIQANMDKTLANFDFGTYHKAIKELLQ